MTRQHLYWALHGGGWVVAIIFFFGMRLVFEPRQPVKTSEIFSWLLYLTIGITLTHVLRLRIKRSNWLELPFSRSWHRYLGAIALIAAVLGAQVVLFGVLFGSARSREMPWSWFLGAWINACFLISLWTATYVTFQMIARYQAARTRALQLELAAEQARLQNLQSQLNPHFLFNSLNSVRALIMEDRERAIEAVTWLAAILRYSLRSDREPTVTVAEEIEMVAHYLALEKTRFEERLRTAIDVDPAVQDAQIPPLLVQTLVENSVKHGIAHLTAGGLIQVEIRRIGGTVEVAVRNTGTLPAVTGESGIGLKNSRERLQLLFGNEAGLDLSEEAGEVVARVKIPYRKWRAAA